MAASAGARTFDVVLYGATGFTGRLAAAYLARRVPTGTLRVALAGRNEAALRALAASVARPDFGVILANSTDAASVKAMAGAARVVMSTAGPFAQYGDAVVSACAEAGTHYCDITGETPWAATMAARYADAAAASGACLISFCGYDSVPADAGVLAAAHFARTAMGGARLTDVVARVRSSGGASGGTLASAMGMAEAGLDTMRRLADPFLLARAPLPTPPGAPPPPPLETVLARPPRGVDTPRPAWDALVRGWIFPFFMASVNTRVVRRSALLAAAAGPAHAYAAPGTLFSYSEASVARRWLTAALGFVAQALALLAMALAPLRALLRRVLPAPGDGPDAAQRARSFFRYTVVATTDAPRRAAGDAPRRVVVNVTGGDPGYEETAKMISECALLLAGAARRSAGEGAVLPWESVWARRGGFFTPSAALGMPLVEALRAAGIAVEVEEWSQPQPQAKL
jgi:short subunit dehydrogenase-like uncharacterized protein